MTLDLSKVKTNSAERAKLYDRMSNWDKLHADVTEKKPTLETLSKMIKVEVTTRKRLVLTTRLLGMYNAEARRQNEKHVRKAMGL